MSVPSDPTRQRPICVERYSTRAGSIERSPGLGLVVVGMERHSFALSLGKIDGDGMARELLRGPHDERRRLRDGTDAMGGGATRGVGGDEAMRAELVGLLEGERLCLDCLARRMQRRAEEVARVLDELSATVRLSQQPALCENCMSVRITYKMS